MNAPKKRRGVPKGTRPAHFTPEHYAKTLAGAAAYRASRPLEVRFWEKVDKAGPGGCWLWTGAIDGWGYGRFALQDGKPVRKAHRVSLWLHGVIADPKGDTRSIHADHLCHVRNCVNPAHLRLCTPRENLENRRDQIAKRNGTLK